jgi:hypothetical protein
MHFFRKIQISYNKYRTNIIKLQNIYNLRVECIVTSNPLIFLNLQNESSKDPIVFS